MASEPPPLVAPGIVATERPGIRVLLSPGILAGALLAVLWLLAGMLSWAVGSSIYATRAISFIGVGPVQSQGWMLPGLWAPVALLLTAAVLVSVTWFVAECGARGGHAFVLLWFAAIVAATVLGLCFDLTRLMGFLPDFGVRGLASAEVYSAPAAAYWGLATGWLPALLVVRRVAVRSTPPRAGRAVIAALASMLLLVVVGSFGHEAWQQQIIRENAEQQGITEDEGAFADPDASGDPVPETAPGVGAPDLDDDSCSTDRATLLLGGSDAATGHRVQVIHLMNFTDEPCVIEGYPDIVFADQNGHELAVTVTRGSSFMAADPGATPVTIPAQGQASAMISWDANATSGALVARQLYAAPLGGLTRGSWPVELDVVADSEVTVTAWHLDDTAGSTP